MAVNVGNGHTVATKISNGEVTGIVEHHTRLLSAQKIEELLVVFDDGKLRGEEVFQDGGHGLFLLRDPSGFSEINRIVAMGPNRGIVSGLSLNVHFTVPVGDVIMTGPIGQIEAVQ